MYDLTKQPVWVQEEVAGLERQVQRLEREVKELRTDEVIDYPADLTWNRPVGIELSKGPSPRLIETLPQGTSVYFKQSRRGGYIEVRQERHNQNELRIMTGGGRLVIQPEVSNVVVVTIKED